MGDVVGILGYYNDNARYDPASDDWAISIRSLDDLQLYYDANGNNVADDVLSPSTYCLTRTCLLGFF